MCVNKQSAIQSGRKMLQLLIVHILLQAGLCISNDSFQVGLQNRFTLIGSNATFNCQISHNQTVDIEWSFSPVHSNKTVVILTTEQTEGQFIGASDVTNVQGSGVSDSKNNVKYYREVWPDLTIVRVTAEDAGTYTARLIQHDMSISAELSLIDSKPECSISDPGPVYYEGEHVTLNCKLGYHANHLPDLEWTVPKLHVDYDHLITTHKNSENMVSTSIDLQLQHMIDGKLFQCSAKFQNITRVTSCTSMFPPESVLYHAYVVDMLTNPRTDIHNRMVDEGSNITLFCNAHGNPKPTWTWFYITDKGEKTRLDCEHRVCVLYVLRHTDTGTYQCHIDNTINGTVYTDHQEIFLKVTPSASKPVHYQSNTARPVAVETHTQTISPYAIGAVVCAGLAVFLIVAFVIMALKMRRREQQQHKRLTRMRDENFDDQEVELLDENIQPDTSELVVIM